MKPAGISHCVELTRGKHNREINVYSIPTEFEDLLEKRAFWHVATIGPTGAPHSSPVWILYDGTYIRFSLTRGRQKFKNLAKHPYLSMSSTDPDNAYRYLEVRGKVVEVNDDPDLTFLNTVAQKYRGQDYGHHQEGDERVMMVVEPLSITWMRGGGDFKGSKKNSEDA